MLHKLFSKKLDDVRYISGLFFVLLLLSIATNIGLIALSFSAVGRERTIIIPPEVQKSFWVDNSRVSKDYLEQMGGWILQLETSVTPQNVKWNHEILLKYALPGSYVKLRSQMDGAALAIARDNIATVFSPQNISVEPDRLRVTFGGILATYMGDRKIADNNKTYIIEFFYTGTKLYLKTFEEATPDNPGLTVTEAKAAKLKTPTQQ